MERLTKAAIATGGAAVLLLGGAGTLAFWTAEGTATGTALDSGTLTVTAGTCEAWEYTPEDGGGPATLIVPGDTVQTECALTVTGTGDHLAVTAELADDAAFAETNPLATALTPTLATGEVLVDGVPAPAEGISIADGEPHTIAVTVTAEFPYGDATTPGNDTQDLTATLADVTVNVVQTHLDPTA
jgi:alternate signal-mediated exported protein